MKREPASGALGIMASTTSPSGYSSGVTTAPTGRPPMWTKSAQRKMTRLYVYTTLPLNKILNVIYAHAPDSAPGPDSANKKLNSLLDKEPRWLRPRTEREVAQRLEQLANSPTRIKAARESDFTVSSSFTEQHGRASRPPYSPMLSTDVKLEPGASPHSLEVPSFHNWAPAPTAADDAWLGDTLYFASDSQTLPVHAPLEDDPFVDHGGSGGGVFDPFLRKTTFMSTSTTDTSGTLQQILHDYSESYVHAVRRLMRRFTAPVVERRSNSPSPDRGSAVQSWLDDDDSPASFRNRPYPLPGDFLSLDLVALQEECHPGSLVHAQRRCMCYAQADEFTAPWVTADGFTQRGERLLNRVILRSEVGVSDAFSNTILHFLAARGSLDALLYALQTGVCAGILNSKNSAGQTFLHVLSRSWMQNINYLCRLLEILAAVKFDMLAVDHYGRNFLHVLLSERISTSDFRRVVELCDPKMQRKRDAFNVIPAPTPLLSPDGEGGAAMDVDSSSDLASPSMSPESKSDPIVARESQLLRHVRTANQDPTFEDDEGRNGLHCLAMATLSMKSVVDKCNLASPSASSPSDKPIKKRPTPTNKPDSSKDRMNLRLGIVTNLLDAGVDPNHYDVHGNTPVMAFAAQLPEDDDYKIGPAILTLLISRGAEINARNRAGETALHIAVRCGRKLAVKTLVNKRANVHARDAGGRGVLDVADTKLMGSRDEDPREYAHYEACRAWLSGRGQAVQDPSVSQEWGSR